MSIQEHKQAMECWRMLEEMDEAARLDVLAELETEPLHISHFKPCTAGLTAVLFHRLKVSVDERDILWLKLFDRPVSRVFNLYTIAKDEKPEKLNALFTSFAKRVPPLGILKVAA